MSTIAPPADATLDRRFFGHPLGLRTLFFTEMWERFSFYGMRALLILFMTASVQRGGLGYNDQKAGAVYGLYTSMIYLMSLPGGWLADNVLGLRRSVLYGGIIIACGHFSMALPGTASFYAGLVLIVLGTGLLKPNVSSIVGQLYGRQDSRRDAGFSIFYMGINLGAFISPILCGQVGEKINWHYGFALAGFGMMLGIVQYAFGSKSLGDAGLALAVPDPEASRIARRQALLWGGAAALLLVLLAAGLTTGWLSAIALSDAFGICLSILVVCVFAGLLLGRSWTPQERSRIWSVFLLFLASCCFWSAFEQAGSTLNLFAERNTNLMLPVALAQPLHLPNPFPASWFQSINSLFLISFAPILAALWIRLGPRDLSSPIKFLLGLIGAGLGFVVLIPVATRTGLSPGWLTLTYFLHTLGELCLSPVGLSAMTKLAPARIASFIMGVFFLSISVGNYLGGRAASLYSSLPLPLLFGAVAGFCFVAALVLLLITPRIKSLMAGVL